MVELKALRVIMGFVFVAGIAVGEFLPVHRVAFDQRVGAALVVFTSVIGLAALGFGAALVTFAVLDKLARRWGMLQAWVDAYRRRLEREDLR